MEEVGGPIQGIDDPGMGLVRALDQAAFLAEEAVAGPRLGQGLEEGLLGLVVGGRDIVCGTLAGDLEFVEFTEVAIEPAQPCGQRRT